MRNVWLKQGGAMDKIQWNVMHGLWLYSGCDVLSYNAALCEGDWSCGQYNHWVGVTQP
jgi:hypothetical protein